jgi:hypothetical protein
MKEVKQKLLRTLLETHGQEKICDNLANIMKTYDILEEEIVIRRRNSLKDYLTNNLT